MKYKNFKSARNFQENLLISSRFPGFPGVLDTLYKPLRRRTSHPLTWLVQSLTVTKFRHKHLNKTYRPSDTKCNDTEPSFSWLLHHPARKRRKQLSHNVTYTASFGQVCQHHDHWPVLFPDHAPEIISRALHRTLRCDVLSLAEETLTTTTATNVVFSRQFTQQTHSVWIVPAFQLE